jgi:dTDP-L-rhamnose 4-epimerase
MRILVTGGAGFIGRHVIKLLAGHPHHYEVIVLDSFEEVVHGPAPDPAVDGALQVFDDNVEDLEAALNALDGCEAVIHLAAGVSVEASYAQPSRFVRTNSLGTAVFWEAIRLVGTIRHVIVASSMSVYGEGSRDRGMVETDFCQPASIYGLSKYESEQLSLLAGKLYDIPVTALRLWNTYGPGQSLTNTETGVVAIFASRLLAGVPPIVYDNGGQLRDFVHVDDVARAFAAALDSRTPGVFNIGMARPHTVWHVADQLSNLLTEGRVRPQLALRHRPGDIRFCYADITQASRLLRWEPHVDLAAGLAAYADLLLAEHKPGQV